MGQVAAAVAHEVNNPCAFILMNSTELLTRVRALCDSVSAGAPPTAEVLKNELTLIETVLLENIDGVERIARIVGDLKVFSSADQGAAETVDVVDLCRSSANMIAHHVRHQARFELDLRSVPVVVAVPQRLSQVVINLVLNAAQAISGSSDANEVRLETWQDGQEVIIAVSDTGCGIPPGARQRIFEPFYSTKSKAQGTGLGLAISVEIVRSIGGRIEVDSTVGQGSQFRVCLRVAPAANESPPPHIRLAEAESAPLRRILLIDDDESVRRAFARALSRTHTVVDVASGEEALQVLTVDREFDAILCDLMMPGLDGIDVIERLTALDPVLAGRTIILSGGAATTRMKRFVDATDIPVLAKPTSIAAINEQIARITAREDE
jgi:CheY-like chemotaxis protein